MATSAIQEYKICNRCKIGLVKSYSHQCKVCFPKKMSGKVKDTGPKIFGYKFKTDQIKRDEVKASKVLLNSKILRRGKLRVISCY
ncbi:hypothetical protein CONCODRAFT_163457 [Conidiobolus coronatus NRRL 28638]|uniref:Uncharacterized protein n=1 Tax=Conidiobolus coronatus (strain ATCC 28846 / CBS 209.66 / NRRL 28638) TaxID=796925 RepID=A0A137P567_CONC2|nr:hypothetical protein CONCODRAFT_163457 [Conidiobolus coronatus NRRL 28638]|eukprot:KXN70160.1 hypothetical protein CONCODRAFT_163457 [Conidiobolus coronatus NRRL 28638]